MQLGKKSTQSALVDNIKAAEGVLSSALAIDVIPQLNQAQPVVVAHRDDEAEQGLVGRTNGKDCDCDTRKDLGCYHEGWRVTVVGGEWNHHA